jgi:hypothetical protein
MGEMAQGTKVFTPSFFIRNILSCASVGTFQPTVPLSKTYASFFSLNPKQYHIFVVHRIHALCLTKETVFIF